jgi:hypothetical protein
LPRTAAFAFLANRKKRVAAFGVERRLVPGIIHKPVAIFFLEFNESEGGQRARQGTQTR